MLKIPVTSYFGNLKTLTPNLSVEDIQTMPNGKSVSLTEIYQMYFYDLGILFFDEPNPCRFSDLLRNGIIQYAIERGLKIELNDKEIRSLA